MIQTESEDPSVPHHPRDKNCHRDAFFLKTSLFPSSGKVVRNLSTCKIPRKGENVFPKNAFYGHLMCSMKEYNNVKYSGICNPGFVYADFHMNYSVEVLQVHDQV